MILQLLPISFLFLVVGILLLLLHRPRKNELTRNWQALIDKRIRG